MSGPISTRFTEICELLGKINPASYNSEQNSGYMLCESYHRVVIIIHTGVLGSSGALDVDIEQALTATGTLKAFGASNDHDITVAETDDNEVHVIELDTSEFDVTNGYKYLNVEITPGAAGIFSCEVWGFVPRYAPASTTGLGSVTD